MQFVVFVLFVTILMAWNVSAGDKYDEDYDKFIQRNFARAGQKHLDKTAEYKQAQPRKSSDDEDDYEEKAADEDDDEEEEEEADSGEAAPPKKSQKSDDEDPWYYSGREDYERIKALSERQVAELTKTPGNCKHYEKDGMHCSTCEDPKTGDNSESCTYASAPKDNKVAYLSKKSHNYKTPQTPENEDDETEDQEEVALNSPPKGPKPLKSKSKSESDDADYGAYRLAGQNDDVEDYDAPKFAHIKTAPKNENVNDFEIIPDTEFKPRDVNQAFTDFKAKDWSKCNKIMKGDMTCYYCKDHKGAVQEECMFISASNPKSYKVERSETTNYDNTKPLTITKTTSSPMKRPIIVAPLQSQSLRQAPVANDRKQRFARIRVGRPLMPTKSTIKSTAETLVTPTTNISPIDHSDFKNDANKKNIKRTISFRKMFDDNDDFFLPSETKAIHFESHVRHFEE